MFAAENKNTSY